MERQTNQHSLHSDPKSLNHQNMNYGTGHQTERRQRSEDQQESSAKHKRSIQRRPINLKILENRDYLCKIIRSSRYITQ